MGSAATEPSAACCQRFGKQSNVLNKQLIRWNDLVAKQPWCRRYAVFSIPKRNNQTVFTEHPKQQRYVHWSVLLTRSQLQADLLFGQFQMLRKSALGPFYCVSFVELILLGVSKPRPGDQIRHPKLFHPVAITYFIDKGKLVYLRKIRWFGRMCHIPKQSHYERGPALELLRNSLCELLAKNLENLVQSKNLLIAQVDTIFEQEVGAYFSFAALRVDRVWRQWWRSRFVQPSQARTGPGSIAWRMPAAGQTCQG